MALTRKFLSALGIEADKIDEIITAHSETVTALKDQIANYKSDMEKYKADAEKLPGVQQELDNLKSEKAKDKPFEQKYNDIKNEYDQYKQGQQEKETTAKKREAYKSLLKEAGVSEKRLDSILRVTDLKDIKIGEDGKIEGADELTKGIKSEWSEFISKSYKKGADVTDPPGDDGNGGGGSNRVRELANKYHDNLYGKSEE